MQTDTALKRIAVVSRHPLTASQRKDLTRRIGAFEAVQVNPPGRLRYSEDAILGVQMAFDGRLPDLVIAVLPSPQWTPFLRRAAEFQLTVLRAVMAWDGARDHRFTGTWMRVWWDEGITRSEVWDG